MGYTTDFNGEFALNTPLKPKMKKYLELLNSTRRMSRNVESGYGTEGEFYVFGEGFMGQGNESNVINHNAPPKTQPGLWCQWTPNEDGTAIVWDEAEKFYEYTTWLVYIITKILAPNGYVLNGVVEYRGEERDDNGIIEVKDNVVFLDGTKITADSVKCSTYVGDGKYQENGIEPDMVLILIEDGKTLNGEMKSLTA